MKSNYDILGNHIRLIDTRNRESITDRVLGINIDKFFMPSVANVIGTDLSKYKLITKGKFACNPMHVGRDERLPVALYDEEEPAIVSPAYFMFEVVDNSILNEDYLMMWFRRPEFDRICWLHTDGSVRGGITWDDICRLELPIPPIEKQLEIVNSYKAITERIALKKKINDNLEATLTATFKKMFVEDTSVEFTSQKLHEIVKTIDNRGKTPPNDSIETPYPLIEIAALRTDGRIATYRNCVKFVSEETYNTWFRSGHPKQKDILMSTVGSLAELKLFWGDKGSIAQNIVAFRCYDTYMPMYLYQYLLRKQHELAAYEIGSVQASIKVSQVVEYDIDIPPQELLIKFDKIATTLTEKIFNNEADIDVCHRLCANLLEQLSSR